MFGKNKQEKHVDQHVYAIYDSIAGTFQLPLFAPNHLVIAREFEGLFQDPNHKTNVLVTNTEGFNLCKIGTYDKKSGELIGQAPEHVLTLMEIKSMVMRRNAGQTEMPLRDVSQ